MAKTKELSKDTRNKIVDLHQAGKTESAIGKQLGVKKSTVGAIIRKWKTYKTTDNLPRSGAPRKISPRGVKMITRTQDNDPKHTSKSTSEWLKQNKMKTLEWPSQSPDLSPIEMLWHDLKKVVHARKPSNVAELQQFCKDEWAKIPPQRCNRLIASYGKRLIAVVAAKVASPRFFKQPSVLTYAPIHCILSNSSVETRSSMVCNPALKTIMSLYIPFLSPVAIPVARGHHRESSLSTYPYLQQPQHLHPLASYPH
ncbi:hypothetical protein QTP70_004722 [Hemibagrus guttatus]|uniref:Tc1-like transposase DDE domain-containing protein n=1 Tax=Hemibagrus guttatus TaxID=175788 RepID=A0AAE0V7X4_9TELE|nr:hypothetical protein QTP70_004722 [Hemibagrus guttatus]